jgi:hypothetical protein
MRKEPVLQGFQVSGSSFGNGEMAGQRRCEVCGVNAEPGYPMALCGRCRHGLARRPLPKWVKAVSLMAGLLALFSLSRFPPVYRAARADNAAVAAEREHRFPAAIEDYGRVLALFPDSEYHRERLAVCYLKAGRIEDARRVM